MISPVFSRQRSLRKKALLPNFIELLSEIHAEIVHLLASSCEKPRKHLQIRFVNNFSRVCNSFPKLLRYGKKILLKLFMLSRKEQKRKQHSSSNVELSKHQIDSFLLSYGETQEWESEVEEFRQTRSNFDSSEAFEVFEMKNQLQESCTCKKSQI